MKKTFKRTMGMAMAAIISVTMAGVLPAAAEEEIYSYNDYVELTQGETKENSLETLEDFLVETVEQSGNSDEGIEPHYSPVEVLYRTYPDGSHYTENRKKCSCHTWCNEYSNCNCIKFATSTQCMAFAKYCHSVFNDFEEYVYESISGYSSQETHTTDNLYSYLKAIGGQSYVRGLTSNRTGHSVFIVGYTKDNVTIYDANYTSSNEGDYCVVHNKDLTYSQFLSRIKYFQYAMTSEGDIINADEI